MTEEIDQAIERMLAAIRYYDLDGKPCERATWMRLFEDTESRRLAHDLVGDVEISTVWLGLDHSFGHGPAPVLWETMLFVPESAGREALDEMYRYSSRERALENHARLAAEYRLLESAQ